MTHGRVPRSPAPHHTAPERVPDPLAPGDLVPHLLGLARALRERAAARPEPGDAPPPQR
ncbi:hypothetical protein [Nocardiopsis sp. CNT312]|uniref:hypothetical protein n=1 Tax=Nocardiopsis sp. CNT312 TaxID=1137268 RepID=UPI0012DCC626|nr:hypothetical protein [Nocardiopsis sp. CNT312]